MRFSRAIAGVIGIAALVASAALVAPGWAAERHSGTVMAVDPQAATVTIQELVENGKPRTVRVHVPAGARVVVSEPSGTFTSAGEDFTDTMIALGEVRPGDFVVLETDGGTTGTVARDLIVTLRAAAK
ncbi:MAG: hypothetical protein HY294_07830 [Candidatus Rokubacteria bacterium]|nr:hypothetical protein [Candidatus Rokubacteria bacterium]